MHKKKMMIYVQVKPAITLGTLFLQTMQILALIALYV